LLIKSKDVSHTVTILNRRVV